MGIRKLSLKVLSGCLQIGSAVFFLSMLDVPVWGGGIFFFFFFKF